MCFYRTCDHPDRGLLTSWLFNFLALGHDLLVNDAWGDWRKTCRSGGGMRRIDLKFFRLKAGLFVTFEFGRLSGSGRLFLEATELAKPNSLFPLGQQKTHICHVG